MKSRKALVAEVKRLEQSAKELERNLDKLNARRNRILHTFKSSLIFQMEEYLKRVLTHLKALDGKGRLPLVFNDLFDPFVVSRGEYTYVNDRIGDCEIIKSAYHLFLDEQSDRVMVCFNTTIRDSNWKDERENVPFAECADWLCGTYDGDPEDREMLMVQILDLLDELRDQDYNESELPGCCLAIGIAGAREFSTGALLLDDRYDSIGNLVFRKGINRIKARQYAGCDRVEVIHIPEGVTEIEDGAFRGCSSLRWLDLPQSLIRIGDNAFEGCKKLQKVVFPKGLLSIGANAFKECQSFKCINLPDSLEVLGSNAFSGVEPCYVSHGLIRIDPMNIGIDEETVLIDRNVGFESEDEDALGDFLSKAKDERANQSYFAIPEGITRMLRFDLSKMVCFFQMPLEVLIPDSMTNISMKIGGPEMITRISVSPDNPKYNSMGDCNAVIEKETNTLIWGCANTIIPNTVKAIGDSAFDRCEGLTSISIPEGVTTIGESAFASCEYLGKVHFPDSLKEIGEDAFLDCISLKDIVIPDSVTTIGEDAFGEITIRTVSIPKGLDISGTGLDKADQIIER